MAFQVVGLNQKQEATLVIDHALVPTHTHKAVMVSNQNNCGIVKEVHIHCILILFLPAALSQQVYNSLFVIIIIVHNHQKRAI